MDDRDHQPPFATLLWGHRRRLGLTQEEVAASAEEAYDGSVDIMRQIQNDLGLAEALERRAHFALQRGDPEKAGECCREAAEAREQLGAPLPPALRTQYEADQAALLPMLGPERIA